MINISRPMTNDIQTVTDFFNVLLQENFPMFTKEAMDAYRANWQPERFASRLANERELILVAWDNNHPVGLIAGTSPEGGVGTIIWLITDKNHRGKQIGTRLLDAGRQHYHQFQCHKIKLTAPSEEARDFYLKNGMLQEGFHKAHWYGLDFWALGECLPS